VPYGCMHAAISLAVVVLCLFSLHLCMGDHILRDIHTSGLKGMKCKELLWSCLVFIKATAHTYHDSPHHLQDSAVSLPQRGPNIAPR
jgi:hypothetical protein